MTPAQLNATKVKNTNAMHYSGGVNVGAARPAVNETQYKKDNATFKTDQATLKTDQATIKSDQLAVSTSTDPAAAQKTLSDDKAKLEAD